MIPPKHPHQAERLAALRATGLLDSPRERDFDEIVALAARLCDAPIAVVNLIDADRQFFKAEVGLGVRETPLDDSICAHVILRQGITVIEDTAAEPCLADNPLVLAGPGLRFYAGALLETAKGLPIGTLCVLDTKPRTLNDLQREALAVLSRQVMRQIELRMALRDEHRLRAELEAEHARRDVLAREVDHRVKNSLQMVASLLRIQAHQSDSDEVVEALDYAQERIAAVGHLHEALHAARDAEHIELDDFLARIAGHLADALPPGIGLDIALAPHVADARTASSIAVVVNELVSNAGKHAFAGGPGRIRLSGEALPEGYRLAVEDDGVGLPPGGAGQGLSQGLGMSLVKAAAQRIDAVLEREPTARGTRFTLRLPPPSGERPAAPL